MRIAICHQTFAGGDAIGRDIFGMCATLDACGHKPFVLCECNVHRANGWEVSHDFSDANLRSIDLVIYHHSQDWPGGRALLERTGVPIVFKYHNVTPAGFFAGYSSDYEERCRSGEMLTRILAQWRRPHVWLCDSAFNRGDIVKAGGDPGRCFVAAPFNNVDQLLGTSNIAKTDAPILRFLFAGRFAPNKAHRHLLRFADAYRRLFGNAFEVVIVGALDSNLRRCWREFTELVRQLDLAAHVRVHPHAPDAAVHELFATAHAYLTFSEHEGFCVPVIEAEAVGLPVVGSGATAVRETAGHGQFLGSPPSTEGEFEFYAELAQLAARDPAVRQTIATNGRRNVLSRFAHDVVETAFLEPILPWLLPRS